MSQYASNTSVSADKSRAEIERLLTKYGATGFMYGWQGDRAMIQFTMRDRMVRFVLVFPSRDGDEFTLTPTGRERAPQAAYEAWEQATRQRWRALKLLVQAKLESVESEITEFDQEFMAQIVLPNGTTVGEWVGPQIGVAYETGGMPALPMPGS